MTTLRERIDALNPWFYDFTLAGEPVVSGVYPPGGNQDASHERLVKRQAERRELIIRETLKRVSVYRRTILDVGCNCAWWSYLFIRDHGAKSVVGIEGRGHFIAQARLLFSETRLFGRAQFIRANAHTFDYETFPDRHFGVVLCAGILYHVPHPLGLLRILARVCGETLLVDTRVAPVQTPGREGNDLWYNAIEETRDRATPGRADILAALGHFGFEAEVIPPPFPAGGACIGSDDYHEGRRMFVVAKRVKR